MSARRGDGARARRRRAARGRLRRSKLRRAISFLAWLCGGLALLSALAWGFRHVWLTPIVVARAQAFLESKGYHLTVEEIGGSWFGDLRISRADLVDTRDRRGLERLAVQELHVEYDLRRWWAGEPDWVERVEAAGIVLRVDARPRDAGKPPGPPGTFRWPSAWPRAIVNGLDLEIALAGGRTMAFRKSGLRLVRASGGNALALDVPELELAGPWRGGVRKVRGVAEGVWRAGRIDLSRLELGGDVVAFLPGSWVDLAETTRGRTAFEIAGAALGGSVRASAVAERGDLEARFELARVELASIARIAGREPLEGEIDARGEVAFAHGGTWCAAEGAARDLCLEGRAVDELRFDAILHPGGLEVPFVELRQGVNRASGEQMSIPIRRDTPLEVLRGSRGEVELELHDVTALSGPSGIVPPHLLELDGTLAAEGAEIRGGRFVTRDGELFVRRGRVTWSRPGEEFLASSRYDVDLAVGFQDLADLGPILGTAPWAGEIAGSLHLAGTLRDPFGAVDLLGSDVVVAGYEIGEIRTQARIGGSRLWVQRLEARGALGELELAGEYDFAAARFESTSAKLATEHLEVLLPGRFAAGSLELEAHVTGPLLEPTAVFEARGAALRAIGAPAIESFALAGSLGGNEVRVSELEAEVEGVTLRAEGAVRHASWALPLRITVDQAASRRGEIEVALAEPCEVRVSAGGDVEIDDFDLAGTGGRLHGRLRTAGADFEARATSDDFAPMMLLRPLLPDDVEIGRAHADVDVARREGRWSGRADLRIDELSLAPDVPPLQVALRAEARDGAASVQSLQVTAPGIGSASLSGELPFDERAPLRPPDGAFGLDLEADVGDLAVFPWIRWGARGTFGGALSLRADLAGTWPDLCGSLSIAADELRWQAEPQPGSASALRVGPADVDARVSLDDGLVLERFVVDGGERIRVDLAGRSLDSASLSSLLAARGAHWRDAGIDLRGSWRIDDLSVLAATMPGLRRAGGRSAGEVALRGTWGSPEGHGALRIEEGEFRLSGGLPAFEAIDAAASFDGDLLTITHCRGELGAGPFQVSGSVDFAGREPQIDFDVSGTELLLVQRPDLRIRADARLELAGPLSALELRGTLETRDSRFTRDVDWFRVRGGGRGSARRDQLFSIEQGPLADLSFDIAIRSRAPLTIRSNVARGGLRADLRLGGTGREPELSGALFLDPTRVFLPASTLDLRSGTLTIRRGDPLDPALDLQLSTRALGYDVTVRVEGTYRDPEVEFSSAPPLPSEDILLLVLAGRPPGEGLAGEAGAEAAETVIVYLGRDLLSRWFDGDTASVLERVEWQTGSDVTQAGGSTAQISIRAYGRAQGEGRAIYLRGERDVYDRINYGVRFLLRRK